MDMKKIVANKIGLGIGIFILLTLTLIGVGAWLIPTASFYIVTGIAGCLSLVLVLLMVNTKQMNVGLVQWQVCETIPSSINDKDGWYSQVRDIRTRAWTVIKLEHNPDFNKVLQIESILSKILQQISVYFASMDVIHASNVSEKSVNTLQNKLQGPRTDIATNIINVSQLVTVNGIADISTNDLQAMDKTMNDLQMIGMQLNDICGI